MKAILEPEMLPAAAPSVLVENGMNISMEIDNCPTQNSWRTVQVHGKYLFFLGKNKTFGLVCAKLS